MVKEEAEKWFEKFGKQFGDFEIFSEEEMKKIENGENISENQESDFQIIEKIDTKKEGINDFFEH